MTSISVSAQSSLDELQRDAAEQRLAEDPRWLALLHYDSGGESYIDDADFFLSPQGARDGSAELVSTLTAFIERPDSQCRYVARRLFLRAQLGEHFAEDCSEYRGWRDEVNADSVVLVFASSYLNSPSSMYGHTFMRFDPPGVENDSTLLSYALNFGANADQADGGMLYAWRGLMGGYPGTFAASGYFEKVKEYSRLENRDLWEYRLNLTGVEVDRMMAHIWELNQVNFDYYFFDENCSFRLLELLDVARPGVELTRQFPLAAIPVDTARVVAEAEMVASRYYRPSGQTKLQFRLDQLDEYERQLVLALAADTAVLESESFNTLSVDRRQTVVAASYRYLRYSNETRERDDGVARHSFTLLRLLASYEKTATPTPPQPVDPLSGHRSSTLAVTAGYEDEDWYGDLEWRIAYHDLLDSSAGFPADTSLNMGRLILRAKANESPQLQQFDILEINSLYPRDDFFQPVSWQVNTGLDRQWTNGKDELVPQVNGGVGLSYHAPLSGRVYSFLRSRLEYNEGFEQNLDIAGGLSLGYLRQQSSGSTQLQAEQLYFSDGVERSLVTIAHNLPLTVNSALRLSFKRSINDSDGINESSLSYRFYF